jgi:hypothetical protein
LSRLLDATTTAYFWTEARDEQGQTKGKNGGVVFRRPPPQVASLVSVGIGIGSWMAPRGCIHATPWEVGSWLGW